MLADLLQTLLFLIIAILWAWLSMQTPKPRGQRLPRAPEPPPTPRFPQRPTRTLPPHAPTQPLPAPQPQLPEEVMVPPQAVSPREPGPSVFEPSSQLATEVIEALHSPDATAHALLFSEILSPPRSKRPWHPR